MGKIWPESVSAIGRVHAAEAVLVAADAHFPGIRAVSLAFSGGVDSAYLLYAAKQMHCDLRAYFVQSQFQPEFELQE